MKKILFLFITSLLFACQGQGNSLDENGAAHTRTGEDVEPNKESYYGKPIAKHVFLFGIDGWAAKRYSEFQIPNIRKLAADGCMTLTKRSVLPSSSAPNWASMFMGVGTEIHGYTEWGSETPEIPSQELNRHNIFPTIFFLLKDQCPEKKVGVVYDWSGIKHLIDHQAVDYQEMSKEYGNPADPADLCKKAVTYIKKEKPNLLAVIWDAPDHAGHSIGWNSQEFLDKVEAVDSYIGQVIQATKDAGIYENSIFIVTADHGGYGKNHGGKTDDEMHTPFIISGKNVKKGEIITTPMMQYDVAATIACIFDLRCPRSWRGRSVTEVFK